jgi:hypothetical protein
MRRTMCRRRVVGPACRSEFATEWTRQAMESWAKVSLSMDFSDYDLTPMFELNEIIWKSVRGATSEMA